MTPHIPEEFSTRLSGWSPFVIMGNAMPPRDPEETKRMATTRKRTMRTRRMRRSRWTRAAVPPPGL